MHNIVCLGTMHTYGGSKTQPFEFYQTWPGHLSKYLDNNNVENYIYNGGESGYSIDYYPFKILNFYDAYRPDLFIVELPIIDKMDVEISPAITGMDVSKNDDYHPIYSRQRVLTKDWQKGHTHAWPNRISINKHESIDLYHNGKIDNDLLQLFKGYKTNTLNSVESNDGVGDHERKNVLSKIKSLEPSIGKEHVQNLITYFYFRSVFMDESDTDFILYLNSILNMINTCLRLNVKILFFNVNAPSFINHHLFKKTYDRLIGNSSFWLENITWYFKQHNPETNDGMYFTSNAWKKFVDEKLGPRVEKIL